MPRKPRRRGRRTLLTPERQHRIVELVEDGNHITTACAHVGIGQSTFYKWLDQARDYDEALAAGQTPDPTKRLYVEFRDRVALARARAEENAVRVIHRAMQGGFVISEEPVQDAQGEVQRDDNGNILYRRTYTQPDGRLALAYLARSAPKQWGQQSIGIELSGPGGTPLEGGEAVGQIAALAERLAAVAAARRADRELESAEQVAAGDEYEDAEIVEDAG
jgi:transposase-like protein